MAIMFTRLLTISAKFVDSSIYNDSSRFDVSAMWRSPSGIFSRKMIRALVLLCMAVLPLVRCHKVRSPVDEYHRDRDRQGRCYSRANASLKQRTRVCVCVYRGRARWRWLEMTRYSRNQTTLIVDSPLIARWIHAA